MSYTSFYVPGYPADIGKLRTLPYDVVWVTI